LNSTTLSQQGCYKPNLEQKFAKKLTNLLRGNMMMLSSESMVAGFLNAVESTCLPTLWSKNMYLPTSESRRICLSTLIAVKNVPEQLAVKDVSEHLPILQQNHLHYQNH
jgi:hypothetical protein